MNAASVVTFAGGYWVRARCRRCGWDGRTYELSIYDKVAGQSIQQETAQRDADAHLCDEEVVRLSAAVRALPGDATADGLEATIRRVLAVQRAR